MLSLLYSLYNRGHPTANQLSFLKTIRTAYLDHLLRRGDEIGAYQPNALPDQPILVLTIAAQLKRTGMEKKLLIGGTNRANPNKSISPTV